LKLPFQTLGGVRDCGYQAYFATAIESVSFIAFFSEIN